MNPVIRSIRFFAPALVLAFAGCGNGESSSAPTLPPDAALVRVSAASPFTADCNGPAQGDTLNVNAEVEAWAAVNPVNPANLVGVWQQDRWKFGGSRGLIVARSFDGGLTWTRHTVPVDHCGGGNTSNGGDYDRASNPWLTFSSDGTAYLLALSFSNGVLQPGSSNAMLVLRSTDGGATWSDPVTLIADGDAAFNDKGTITADPSDPNYVYAIWDRITTTNTGPTYFTRTTDGGSSWEPARAIYDPGANSQTISNEIVVLPDGTLVDFFLLIALDAQGNARSSQYAVVRSTDRGASWSQPIIIARNLAVGTRDPDTGALVRDSAIIGQITAGPGGELVTVWQDARFSNGKHDGIAFSRSSDGGLTWSAPAEINGDPDVAAFTPSVRVLADGTIGVSYYDFRPNTSDSATLLTRYWLTTSTDSINWNERAVSDPFDLDLAPESFITNTTSGLFLGDYQALADSGGIFVPFFVQTNSDNAGNRTDVYVLPPGSETAVSAVRP
ncbi:MAG TPA: sialidase family protein [Gammaproteobacteria bacterium]|nr:sialidase family protein [Gammaproteobacteria bacterium]